MTMIAIDQYNDKVIIEGKHPRKELLEKMGATTAEKIYVGDGVHVGYIVLGHWFRLYTLTDWTGK